MVKNTLFMSILAFLVTDVRNGASSDAFFIFYRKMSTVFLAEGMVNNGSSAGLLYWVEKESNEKTKPDFGLRFDFFSPDR
jgi:hypothetical protein